MKNLILLSFLSLALLATAKPKTPKAVMYTTTETERMKLSTPIIAEGAGNVVVYTDSTLQTMRGCGGTFSELGWDAMQSLSEKDRDAVMAALFSKEGLNLPVGRTPLGCNDMSIGYYSYNDVKEDYTMRNFSIGRDKFILIPFIKAALKYRPDLMMWASPWTPPIWMKVNEHYSQRADGVNHTKTGYNELAPQHNMTQHFPTQGFSTGFKMMDGYLKAYALYFSKYVQEYAKEGVKISYVAPQNEVCWTPCWPSCTWRPEDLSLFVNGFLAPQLEADGLYTKVWYATFNYPKPEYMRTILDGRDGDKYVKTIGVQWSGVQALPTLHKEYPQYEYVMTEAECGDHELDWSMVEKTWDSMLRCFNNGITTFVYWNMVHNEEGKSWWEWPQNSLVIVDRASHSYSFSHEYYLLKHVSPFVQPGSIRLKTTDSDVLAFRNPEGKTIVVMYNKQTTDKRASVEVAGVNVNVTLKAKSINTLVLQ